MPPQGHARLDQDARPARRQVHRARGRHAPTSPRSPIGGEIPAAPGAGIEKLLEGSGDLLTDLSAIARSLKNILGRTEKGKGFLGAITSNSEESEQLGNNFNADAPLPELHPRRRSTRARASSGRLLIDEKYGRETSESLARRDQVGPVAARQDRRGRAHRQRARSRRCSPIPRARRRSTRWSTTSPDGGRARSRRSPTTSRRATARSRSCCTTSSSARSSPANLRSFSEHLDSICAQARRRPRAPPASSSTIPSIFDAANHLVVGVNESALLRWLIKDRQKSGIKKEYNDAVARPGRRRGARRPRRPQ